MVTLPTRNPEEPCSHAAETSGDPGDGPSPGSGLSPEPAKATALEALREAMRHRYRQKPSWVNDKPEVRARKRQANADARSAEDLAAVASVAAGATEAELYAIEMDVAEAFDRRGERETAG